MILALVELVAFVHFNKMLWLEAVADKDFGEFTILLIVRAWLCELIAVSDSASKSVAKER